MQEKTTKIKKSKMHSEKRKSMILCWRRKKSNNPKTQMKSINDEAKRILEREKQKREWKLNTNNNVQETVKKTDKIFPCEFYPSIQIQRSSVDVRIVCT